MGVRHHTIATTHLLQQRWARGSPQMTFLRIVGVGECMQQRANVFPSLISNAHTTTIPPGNVDARGLALIRCAHDALAAAISLIRPGLAYRDIGTAISCLADGRKFSVVRSYCGHGIGRAFHCAPNVPHYARNKAVGIVKAGHVFTVEPMINEGSAADELWPDNWTAVTRDGKRSAQFEHMVLVTETGVEILTARVGASRSEMVWDEAFEGGLGGKTGRV